MGSSTSCVAKHEENEVAGAPNITNEVHIKSLLVATDFTPASEKALLYGLSIARYYGCKLYLMHVVSPAALSIAGPEAIAKANVLAFRRASLTERRLITAGVLRDVRHRVIIHQGDIWTELQAEIRDHGIDLLIVGTHGRGLKRLVLGSVAEQIFRHSCCGVLTVGPCSPDDAWAAPEGTPGPLLFATDFSEASLAALPYAVSLANHLSTKLVLLHMLPAIPEAENNCWYGAIDVAQIRAAAEAAPRKRLQDLIANIRFAVEPELVIGFDEPAGAILRAAQSLRAVIVIMGLGYKSHIEIMSHLPWSTAYEVVCGAECPVLTVRTESTP